MSPYLHYEIARAPREEIASRAVNSHRSHSGPAAINRRRSVKYRLVQVLAVLGVCGAAGTAVKVSAADSSQPPTKQHVHVSAKQLMRETRALEAKGFEPTACTVSGTVMRNYSTGQSVTVNW